MNNIKKNRTRLKLLGNGRRARFTMNKTQQNQPVYSKVQPRCPGSKGNKAGQICKGSNTNVGCQTCYGCLYSFDVSSNTFNGAYPTYGSFASVNLIVDSSPKRSTFRLAILNKGISKSNSIASIFLE